jgi:starch synthase (maltosyl-transferring)
MLLWKASTKSREQALIILNKDPWNRQYFRNDDLYRYVQCPPPLKDVSLEYAMEHLPTPFEFELHPGMGRILVSA